MLDEEVSALWDFVKRSVNRILSCLEGLDEDDLNWHPISNANSLYVIATHIVANIEANILGVLCGERIVRQRDKEFKAYGTNTAPIKQKWDEVQEKISTYLSKFTSADLNKEYQHPRMGVIKGRNLLITVSRHAAEHVGHAELTRDLLFTARGRTIPKRDF